MSAITDQLDILIQQKEALYARSDIDPDEKDRLARRLRREIRKLRGDSDAPSAGSNSDKPKRIRSSGRPDYSRGEVRSASAHPEQFTQFKAEVLEFLTDLPLEWKDPAELTAEHLPVMGIDFVYLYEHDVSGDQILEKFQNRWANKFPKWFTVIGNNSAEILGLGPLPAGMVQN